MIYSRPYRFAFSSPLFWVLVGWMQLLCVCCTPISWRLQTVQPSWRKLFILLHHFLKYLRSTVTYLHCIEMPAPLASCLFSPPSCRPTHNLSSQPPAYFPPHPHCERFGLDPFTYKLFLFFRVYRFRRVPHPELITIAKARHPLIHFSTSIL